VGFFVAFASGALIHRVVARFIVCVGCSAVFAFVQFHIFSLVKLHPVRVDPLHAGGVVAHLGVPAHIAVAVLVNLDLAHID
jgi:hypothetical protein